MAEAEAADGADGAGGAADFALHGSIKALIREALAEAAGRGRKKKKPRSRSARKRLRGVLRVTWDLDANTYHLTYSPAEYDRSYSRM